MSEFEVFHHPQFGDIRAKVENGVDWFVAKDVCDALGYKNMWDAIAKHVEEVDKKNTLVNREGIHRGNPNMTVITEMRI